MVEWLIPSQDSIADDEVKHLFAAADDDDDDVLRYVTNVAIGLRMVP